MQKFPSAGPQKDLQEPGAGLLWGQHVARRTPGEDSGHGARRGSLLATLQLWRDPGSASSDPVSTHPAGLLLLATLPLQSLWSSPHDAAVAFLMGMPRALCPRHWPCPLRTGMPGHQQQLTPGRLPPGAPTPVYPCDGLLVAALPSWRSTSCDHQLPTGWPGRCGEPLCHPGGCTTASSGGCEPQPRGGPPPIGPSSGSLP